MTYREKLQARINDAGSHLCVGLDVRADTAAETTKRWLRRVVEQTAPYAAAFKPNAAYYEAYGWKGLRMLKEVLKDVPNDIPIIFDTKRGDIGETQAYYAKSAFEEFGADAITLSPYMGRDSLEPFLEYKDCGVYLLGVTSNSGAADIQMQKIGKRHVFELVADMTAVSEQVGLVLGLTNAADVLKRIPDVPLLIPGLGAQGGDLEVLTRGTARRAPVVINVSRGILYQEDSKSFAERAEAWRDQIEQTLKRK